MAAWRAAAHQAAMRMLRTKLGPQPPAALTDCPSRALLQEKAAADGAPLLHSPPLKGPCPLVSITPIHDPKHPACGQHGLFAARNLLAGSLVLDYV